MDNIDALKAYSLKAFVAVLNFECSKAFYINIGFKTRWNDSTVVNMEISGQEFLLQNFYVKELAEYFVTHLLVENADAWRKKIDQTIKLNGYDTFLSSPPNQTWN